MAHLAGRAADSLRICCSCCVKSVDVESKLCALTLCNGNVLRLCAFQSRYARSKFASLWKSANEVQDLSLSLRSMTNCESV